MRLFLKIITSAFCALWCGATLLPAEAVALTAPRRAVAAPAAGEVVVKTHSRHHYRSHYRSAKRHYDHVVDAPFTRVRSGHRVEVDAPFTSVTVSRRGRHIRAPFVDLWIPRGR